MFIDTYLVIDYYLLLAIVNKQLKQVGERNESEKLSFLLVYFCTQQSSVRCFIKKLLVRMTFTLRFDFLVFFFNSISLIFSLNFHARSIFTFNRFFICTALSSLLSQMQNCWQLSSEAVSAIIYVISKRDRSLAKERSHKSSTTIALNQFSFTRWSEKSSNS